MRSNFKSNSKSYSRSNSKHHGILMAVILGTAVLSISILTGCSDSQSENKSMEQLYAEQGVPVKVTTVAPQEFIAANEYKAVLTGIEESSAFSAVSDKIDKINYKVGDRVKKDDVVLTFPTDNPKAGYYQAKVAYENAEATYERMKGYYEAGGLSKQDLDNARTSYEVARADWDNVRQSVMIKAPISGVITSILVSESDNIDKEQEVFTVARMDRLKARFWVSERDIADFKPGLEAAAVWHGIKLQGKVTQADLSMNQERQAFGVVTEFDNPDLKVRAGVTGTITVESYRHENAIVVARKDILNDANGSYVYIARDGKAIRQPVTVGRSTGIRAEILAGLTAGDTLITEGQLLLENGKNIRIVETGQPIVSETMEMASSADNL